MKSGIAPAALLALCSQVVCAQCDDWSIDDVPDFDQRREDTASVQGLPGDGGMYCGPTSALNWFAYFANRGIEQPGTLGGPRDWQAAAQYDLVTDVDLLMGVLMDTDAEKGTRGGLVPGAKAYSALFTGGDILVSGSHVWGGGESPSPELFNDYNNLGGYIQAAYGFYSSSTGGTRDGGHLISITGVWGCPLNPILFSRDPANDPANITQSQFRTSLAALTKVTGQFRQKTGETYESKTMYRLDVTDPGTVFLDSITVFLPAAAIFGSGLESAGEIKVVRPVRPAGNPMPLTQSFNKPAGTGRILDTEFDADMRWYYYVTAQGTQKSSVWRLDPLTGQSAKVITAPFDPRRIALGRFNDLYVIEGPDVVRYDLSTFPATRLADITPSLRPDDIAYNDVNDTVVILTETGGISSRRVISVPRSLTGFGTNRLLAASVSGEGFIALDDEEPGAFWVCADGSTIVRRFIPDGTSLVQTDAINHAPGARITGLNMTDGGSLVYALDGRLVELVKSTRGVWVSRPDSRWAGRAADGSVSIARSRTNWTALMDDPAFYNTPTPVLFPSQPDCIADCDGSGSLDFFDFLCFQNQFAAGDLSADCDLSWNLDFFDFLCFQNVFAGGCP